MLSVRYPEIRQGQRLANAIAICQCECVLIRNPQTLKKNTEGLQRNLGANFYGDYTKQKEQFGDER